MPTFASLLSLTSASPRVSWAQLSQSKTAGRDVYGILPQQSKKSNTI